MGGLFASVMKAIGGLFGGGAAGGAAKGIASAAGGAKGAGGLGQLLGSNVSKLPYSPNGLAMSPIGNGNTAVPQSIGMEMQQAAPQSDMMSSLGAAMGHSVGSKGGPGRQMAEQMGQVNPEMLQNSQGINPMTMMSAVQNMGNQQQRPQGPQFAANPWLEQFMQQYMGR